ncbi:hypothetical protein [Fibrella aquatilis]|uniref:Uncharacterized protein n=1 Tax=Fibrella aquatilis TaxID=2817059 RepID=A0A939G3F6_9BACT|nr:hypothetical protein [Fibrella aquatilis]MBO0930380.1 hypothetical protein [Fibrella aquatilis]
MTTKFSTVLLVFLARAVWAQPDTTRSARIVPLTIRPAPAGDSVSISRYDLAKLELARQTLLAIDYTDTDELISILKEQAALSDQGREQLMALTQTRLRTLQDSLQRQTAALVAVSRRLERAGSHLGRDDWLLSQTAASLRRSRRRLWWERMGTGALGVALGITVGSFSK